MLFDNTYLLCSTSARRYTSLVWCRFWSGWKAPWAQSYEDERKQSSSRSRGYDMDDNQAGTASVLIVGTAITLILLSLSKCVRECEIARREVEKAKYEHARFEHAEGIK